MKSDMGAVVRVMQLPDSGLEIRDRMWLKITIANAVIGEGPAPGGGGGARSLPDCCPLPHRRRCGGLAVCAPGGLPQVVGGAGGLGGSWGGCWGWGVGPGPCL